MADEMEKKLMRLKKEDLKEEARQRSLSETGTKADLVSLLKFQILLLKKILSKKYVKKTKMIWAPHLYKSGQFDTPVRDNVISERTMFYFQNVVMWSSLNIKKNFEIIFENSIFWFIFGSINRIAGYFINYNY